MIQLFPVPLYPSKSIVMASTAFIYIKLNKKEKEKEKQQTKNKK